MSTSLFVSGSEWFHNAIVHHNYDENGNKWEAYVIGYRLAAESLAEKVLNEIGNRDTLIFPIVFLYRQYLELRFKEFIEHGSILLDAEFKLPKHHDLMILWSKAKVIISEIWPTTILEDYENIDVVIKDFVNVDKQSDGFRYPINKNGDFTLNALRMINLKVFKDAIDPIISELEGISLGISAYQAHKNELAGYMYKGNSVDVPDCL